VKYDLGIFDALKDILVITDVALSNRYIGALGETVSATVGKIVQYQHRVTELQEFRN
jgi:hypothetical protein